MITDGLVTLGTVSVDEGRYSLNHRRCGLAGGIWEDIGHHCRVNHFTNVQSRCCYLGMLRPGQKPPVSIHLCGLRGMADPNATLWVALSQSIQLGEIAGVQGSGLERMVQSLGVGGNRGSCDGVLWQRWRDRGMDGACNWESFISVTLLISPCLVLHWGERRLFIC